MSNIPDIEKFGMTPLGVFSTIYARIQPHQRPVKYAKPTYNNSTPQVFDHLLHLIESFM